jgi:hypothetical protein
MRAARSSARSRAAEEVPEGLAAKNPQTMAKRAREQAVKERRERKRAKKAEAAAARADAKAAAGGNSSDADADASLTEQ